MIYILVSSFLLLLDLSLVSVLLPTESYAASNLCIVRKSSGFPIPPPLSSLSSFSCWYIFVESVPVLFYHFLSSSSYLILHLTHFRPFFFRRLPLSHAFLVFLHLILILVGVEADFMLPLSVAIEINLLINDYY